MNAYSNDVAFYVASKRVIPEGGYEVDRSMIFYGQPGPLAEDTEDQIVRVVRSLRQRQTPAGLLVAQSDARIDPRCAGRWNCSRRNRNRRKESSGHEKRRKARRCDTIQHTAELPSHGD